MEIIKSFRMGATEERIERISKVVLEWMDAFLLPSQNFPDSKYKVKNVVRKLKLEQDPERKEAMLLLTRLWVVKSDKERKKQKPGFPRS